MGSVRPELMQIPLKGYMLQPKKVMGPLRTDQRLL